MEATPPRAPREAGGGTLPHVCSLVPLSPAEGTEDSPTSSSASILVCWEWDLTPPASRAPRSDPVLKFEVMQSGPRGDPTTRGSESVGGWGVRRARGRDTQSLLGTLWWLRTSQWSLGPLPTASPAVTPIQCPGPSDTTVCPKPAPRRPPPLWFPKISQGARAVSQFWAFVIEMQFTQDKIHHFYVFILFKFRLVNIQCSTGFQERFFTHM